MDEHAAPTHGEVEVQGDVVLFEIGGSPILRDEVFVDALGDEDVGGGLGQTIATESPRGVGRRNERQDGEGILRTALDHVDAVGNPLTLRQGEDARGLLARAEDGLARWRLGKLKLSTRLGWQPEARHEGEVGPTGLGVVVEIVEHRLIRHKDLGVVVDRLIRAFRGTFIKVLVQVESEIAGGDIGGGRIVLAGDQDIGGSGVDYGLFPQHRVVGVLVQHLGGHEDAAILGGQVQHQGDIVLLEVGRRAIIGREVLVDTLGDEDVGRGFGQAITTESAWRIGRRNEGQDGEGILRTAFDHIHSVLDASTFLEFKALRGLLAGAEDRLPRRWLGELELPARFGGQPETRHEGEVGPTGLGVVVEVVEHLGLKGQAQRCNGNDGESGSDPSRKPLEKGILRGCYNDKGHGFPELMSLNWGTHRFRRPRFHFVNSPASTRHPTHELALTTTGCRMKNVRRYAKFSASG